MNGLISLSAPERKLEYIGGVISMIRKVPFDVDDEKHMNAGIVLVGRRQGFTLRLPYKNERSGLEPFSDGQRVRLYSEEEMNGLFVELVGLESLSAEGIIFERVCKFGYAFTD